MTETTPAFVVDFLSPSLLFLWSVGVLSRKEKKTSKVCRAMKPMLQSKEEQSSDKTETRSQREGEERMLEKHGAV